MSYVSARALWHYIAVLLILARFTNGGWQSSTDASDGLHRVSDHAASHHKAMALELRLYFLEVIQAPEDLGPFQLSPLSSMRISNSRLRTRARKLQKMWPRMASSLL